MSLRNRVWKHVAAAVVATVTVAPAAADIVHSGVVNLNIPSNVDGLYLNVVTGAGGTAGSAVPGWDVNPWSGTTLSWFASVGGGYARGGGASTTLIDNLPVGTVIGSGLSYGGGNSETTGATAFVLNSEQNLVGFRFINEATATLHYGWMRLSLAGTLQGHPARLSSTPTRARPEHRSRRVRRRRCATRWRRGRASGRGARTA